MEGRREAGTGLISCPGSPGLLRSRSWRLAAARPLSAEPALAVCGHRTRAVGGALDAAGAPAVLAEVARAATRLIDASEVLAIVAGRTTQPVLAMVHAVSVARRAAAARARTRAAPAVGIVAAHAGVRAFDPTISTALVIEVTRRAASLADARIILPAVIVTRTLPRARRGGQRE
jgi:hypothetical protein